MFSELIMWELVNIDSVIGSKNVVQGLWSEQLFLHTGEHPPLCKIAQHLPKWANRWNIKEIPLSGSIYKSHTSALCSGMQWSWSTYRSCAKVLVRYTTMGIGWKSDTINKLTVNRSLFFIHTTSLTYKYRKILTAYWILNNEYIRSRRTKTVRCNRCNSVHLLHWVLLLHCMYRMHTNRQYKQTYKLKEK